MLDLIPVVSFLFLRARCRMCKNAISWQYPLVELISGMIFLYALHHEFPSIGLSILLGVSFWLLLLIAVTDAKTSMIPDALTIPFILLSVLFSTLKGSPFLLPAIIGGGFFGLQWLLNRGKWVGSGDIILAIGIGAFLGNIPLLLLSLWIAYVLGAFFAVILLLQKQKALTSRLAFGPFLIVGAVVAFGWGQKILGFLFP